MRIEKINFHGVEAVLMETDVYEAIMIPSVGANLVKLYHKERKLNILHAPDESDISTFLSRPHVYGLPLLFPPNRIEDGRYEFEGREYKFPITKVDENNYHHGIIKSQPFTVRRTTIGDDYVEVEAVYFSNIVNDEIYRDFHHQFECRMTYILSNEGLEQTVTFVNDSETDMPIGVGFHTPINVPFGGDAQYRMWLSCGEEWELNDRSLPTGNLLPLDHTLKQLRTTGLDPLAEPIERALTNSPIIIGGNEYNGAIIQNQTTGDAVFYEVDEQYQHWTIWNNNATAGYICPEPQTWAINAPNLPFPADVTGLQWIEPGDAWSAVTKIYVK